MKVLKIAAIVVGAVVTLGTGIALIGGAASLGAAFAAVGMAAGTVGISGTAFLAISAGALLMDASMIAGGLQAKPSQGGEQTTWKADPYAGIPYVMGRTLVSGNIVARIAHGSNNQYEGFVTVLSLGPINAIEASFLNKTTVSYPGGDATGTYHTFAYQADFLGDCPQATAIGVGFGYPDWGSDRKISGLAHIFNSFRYDAKADPGMTSEPKPAWIIEGVKVYDPRLDSTYPGGSGACRALDESTYVYSENPHLHALTWVLGRFQNGIRVAGIGAPLAAIDVASFVEGANLNDARGWKLGGTVYTRPDTPWNSLKAMLQAGGSRPTHRGGIYACINQAPRVSLATITHRDIVGKCSLAGTQGRRVRLNGVIPQYRSEAHDWQMVSAAGVFVSSYVTFDGDERTKEIAYPLVQQVDQVAALARYDIEDSREAGPGTVPLKPAWLNYRVGDCVTFEPEDGFSMKALILGRALDAQAGTVTFTIRSETDGKHAFALGQTGVAPPTASLIYSDAIAAPIGDWALSGGVITASDGGTVPALILTGASTNGAADAIVVEYRVVTTGQGDDDDWFGASVETSTLQRKEITSVTAGTAYQVSVRYRVRNRLGARAILGPATPGDLAINGGNVQPGTIDTPQIVPYSVTRALQASNGSSISFAGYSSWTTVVAISVTMAAAGDLLLEAPVQLTFGSTLNYRYRLVVNDGTTDFGVQSGSGNIDHYITGAGCIAVAAGTYTCRLDMAADVGVSLNGGAAVLVSDRRYR